MSEVKSKNSSSVNPIAVGVVGLVAGAVGTAVAIALSDKKNRRKVEKTLQDTKEWATQTMSDVQKQAKPAMDSVKEKVQTVSSDAKDKAEDVSKEVRDMTEKKTVPNGATKKQPRTQASMKN